MPKWQGDWEDEDYETFEKIHHPKKVESDAEKLAKLKKLNKPVRISRPEKE